MSLVNYYRKEKKFPSTISSSFVQMLILNPSYDTNITVPLLEGTRFNRPYRDMLLTDVIRAEYLESLFTDDDNEAQEIITIDKFKIERKPLICAIFVNLVRFSDLAFVKIIVDNFLVHDFDYFGANMVGILQEMIQNEVWLRNEPFEGSVDSQDVAEAS